MRIPSILPDEWLPGYVGRLRCQNFLAIEDRVLAQQLGMLLVNRGRSFSLQFMEFLSRLLDIDVGTLVYQHTLVPSKHAIGCFTRNESPPNLCDARHLRGAFTEGASQSRHCPKCVEEDLMFWGFTFWRRSHQLHGVLRCAKHRCRLLSNSDKGPAEFSPHQALAGEADSFNVLEDHPDSNEVVCRYETLMDLMLDGVGRLVCASDAHLKIQAQARRRGISVAQRDSDFYLKDSILDAVPAGWLWEYFPSMRTSTEVQSGQSFNCVELAGGWSRCVPEYALLLALLWEDPEAALVAIIEDGSSEASTSKRTKTRSAGKLFWHYSTSSQEQEGSGQRWGSPACLETALPATATS